MPPSRHAKSHKRNPIIHQTRRKPLSFTRHEIIAQVIKNSRLVEKARDLDDILALAGGSYPLRLFEDRLKESGKIWEQTLDQLLADDLEEILLPILSGLHDPSQPLDTGILAHLPRPYNRRLVLRLDLLTFPTPSSQLANPESSP
jgi:hypothetical protein